MTFLKAHDKMHQFYDDTAIRQSVELFTVHAYLTKKIKNEGKGDEEITASGYMDELITKYLQ